jgi:hypothetical protein
MVCSTRKGFYTRNRRKIYPRIWTGPGKVKKKVVSVPVFCASRLDPALGKMYLRQGSLDFVGMTRRLLADPELPNKVKAGKLESIRVCTGCLHCIDVRNKNKLLECQVNPSLGREREYEIKPAEKKKKVLVIGGGPSGMKAARVAALRGHEVKLMEKGPRLGGLIPTASLVKELEIDDLLNLVGYFSSQMSDLGAKVTMSKEAADAEFNEYKPDGWYWRQALYPAILTCSTATVAALSAVPSCTSS